MSASVWEAARGFARQLVGRMRSAELVFYVLLVTASRRDLLRQAVLALSRQSAKALCATSESALRNVRRTKIVREMESVLVESAPLELKVSWAMSVALMRRFASAAWFV